MEQQIAVSEKLNPNKIPREPFGIKARSMLNRITLTPSEASPNETLYVDIPKLAENMVLVLGSAYLTFDLNVTGHANNTLVNNVGRNNCESWHEATTAGSRSILVVHHATKGDTTL